MQGPLAFKHSGPEAYLLSCVKNRTSSHYSVSDGHVRNFEARTLREWRFKGTLSRLCFSPFPLYFFISV